MLVCIWWYPHRWRPLDTYVLIFLWENEHYGNPLNTYVPILGNIIGRFGRRGWHSMAFPYPMNPTRKMPFGNQTWLGTPWTMEVPFCLDNGRSGRCSVAMCSHVGLLSGSSFLMAKMVVQPPHQAPCLEVFRLRTTPQGSWVIAVPEKMHPGEPRNRGYLGLMFYQEVHQWNIAPTDKTILGLYSVFRRLWQVCKPWNGLRQESYPRLGSEN